MNGHEPIIAMRLSGKKPEIVFIEDFDGNPEWEKFGEFPTVSVKGDDIKTLDLRFLVGLVVSASGSTEKRSKELLEACKRHKVRFCISSHRALMVNHWNDPFWMEYFGEMNGKNTVG